MATLSQSSRGILTGMPAGGGTLRVSKTDVIVHVCIDGQDTQADSIYLFAYIIPSPSATSQATLVIDVQERMSSVYARTRLLSVDVPAHPNAPIVVLNNVLKSNGAIIYASAPRCDIAVFGWYTRQVLSVAPASFTTAGSLVFVHQTVVITTAAESVVLSPSVPVTLLMSQHTSSLAADAYLGPAQEGTYKIITLVSKNPNALGDNGETVGNIRLRFYRFRLPDGIDNNSALGTMLFKRIGDSAQLLYTGALGWMIIGSGVYVE